MKHNSQISFDYECIVIVYLELFPAVRCIHEIASSFLLAMTWDAASIRARTSVKLESKLYWRTLFM